MMFGHHRSIEVVCPHCGGAQMEPRGIVSTYCRSCSQHFTPASRAAARTGEGGLLNPTRVAKGDPSDGRENRVSCHTCGHNQRAHHGVAEAPCRHCGTMMSYRDIEISNHTTREVCTHGHVLVTRKGFLNSTRVRCASAHVEGRISGRVDCTGTLRLAGVDLCKAQIRVGSLHVDRGADISLVYTATIGSGVIGGRVLGDIICTGSLKVTRRGVLLGDVETAALSVDRGGVYSGDVRVGYEHRKVASNPSEDPHQSTHGLWLPGFALGAA
ncbi:MAG: bactofilin family protein [Chthoniobacterales bacterium]